METNKSFSEIRKALESDQKSATYKPKTIEELMQILTSNNTDNDQVGRRAPPIPPKPKNINQSSDVERSFRKYNSTNLNSNCGHGINTSTVDINFNSDTTFQNNSMHRDYNNDNNNEDNSFLKTGHIRHTNNDNPIHFTNASFRHSPVDAQILHENKLRDTSFSSRASEFNIRPNLIDPRNSTKLNLACGGDEMNHPTGMSKPNKSTVEISEIDEKFSNHHAPNSNNYHEILGGKNPTFSRVNRDRLFYENNYAKPVVTAPDDDDIDQNMENAEPLVNPVDFDLDQSTRSQPPRTSTPSFECSGSSGELSQNGINDNTNPHNSTYSKLDVDSSNSVLSSNTRQEIDDALDISRDSDTCVFNVSDGCEVVDVVNTTNSTNNSTNSAIFTNNNTNANQTYSNISLNRTPTEMGLDFTDNVANRFSTPKMVINNNNTNSKINNNASHARHESTFDRSSMQPDEKVEKLEKLTSSLMEEVSRLSQQVEDLTSQMNAMQLSNNSASHFSLSSTYGNGSTSTLNHTGLSSYGNHSISTLALPSLSTLRRENLTSACGSVSNLSQIGTTSMTNIPCSTDYIPAKHSAKEVHYSPEEQLIRMSLYDNAINIRVPTMALASYDPERIIEQPQVKLALNWVHGYRGRDCRCNLHFLPTGECIYFVASIVVLHNPIQNTQRHYLGHTDSVKCLAVHPNRLIIASGQSAIQNRPDKRPIVRVWNTVSLATIRVISFNEDFDRSICCLAFSKHDCGATLAVVDESNEHTITLLDWQKEKNWRVAEANSGHEPVLAIDFHPIDKYSLIAIGKSSINFWDIRGMTMSKKAGLFDKFDKPKYVLCLTFNDQGEIITGDSNGNIMIWPRGTNRPRKIVPNVHVGGVFSILAMKDRTFLSGGKDRRVVEWDENYVATGRQLELPEHCGGVRYITSARRSDVLIGTLRNCILMGSLDDNFSLIVQGHATTPTALSAHPSRDEYLTGGYDDQLYLYNAITHQVLWSKCLTMAAHSVAFSPDQPLIIVGSVSGKWLVMDSTTQEILFTKCDGSGTINCIKFSPDGQYFAMGSTDGLIYIYQVTSSGSKFWRVGNCAGHSGPVKELDWSIDGIYLQSQSMNFELLFWKAENCRQIDDLSILDYTQWNTQNCTLGFNVIGVWTDDSTIVEYCERSPKNDVIVTSTNTGHINLFDWPANHNQCVPQKLYGNVDKYDKIKFLLDGQKLVAISSKNCVTTEWTLTKTTAI